MKLADITAWLASEQDFAQGVALYAALGENPTYKRLFSLGTGDYTYLVLRRELAALLAPVGPPEPAAASPLPVATALALPATVQEEAASPLLAKVLQELKATRDERSHLHPQLTAKGLRQKERQKIAGRIVVLTDQEGELKATEAHVRQHGRLPGLVPITEVSEAGELRRRLQNLVSQRTKLRKRADRADDLVACEAAITLIRIKLAQPNV
ncbi:MAG: hypothetical protein ACRYF0_09510 [Janthinobacterium lividum]